MKHRTEIAAVAATLAALGIGHAPTRAQQPPPSTEPAVVPVTESGTVRRIELPEAVPSLPEAPGRLAVVTYCAMCHTPDYIMLQPALSRETWVAEVTKMRTTFSGPIPDEKVPEIVEYLMAVRGAPAK